MHEVAILEYQEIQKEESEEPRTLGVKVTDKRDRSGFFRGKLGLFKGKSTKELEIKKKPPRFHRCLLIDNQTRYDVIGDAQFAFKLNITNDYHMDGSNSHPVTIKGPKSFKSDDFDTILKSVAMPGPFIFREGDEFDKSFYDEEHRTDCQHWSERAYNTLN